MIRRTPLRLALATAATAVALSGCATFTNTDVVARVDGVDVTLAEFEPLAEEFFANPVVFGTTPTDDGRASAEQSRFLLGFVVRQRLVDQFLDRHDIDASEIRQAFKDSVLATTPIAGLSVDIQNLVTDVDPDPASQALALVETPDIDELRAMYADNPATTGMICIRHILVDTESAAERVLDELADGADFATLAVERSIDPSAADGGALTSGPNQCTPVRTAFQSFGPSFTLGTLFAAREGVPSVPLESPFGWHVVLHRPWDEVAESVAQLHQPGDSGGYLFDGYVATTEVEIDPRFGSWDPLSNTALPIG